MVEKIDDVVCESLSAEIYAVTLVVTRICRPTWLRGSNVGDSMIYQP